MVIVSRAIQLSSKRDSKETLKETQTMVHTVHMVHVVCLVHMVRIVHTSFMWFIWCTWLTLFTWFAPIDTVHMALTVHMQKKGIDRFLTQHRLKFMMDVHVLYRITNHRWFISRRGDSVLFSMYTFGRVNLPQESAPNPLNTEHCRLLLQSSHCLLNT